MRDACERCDDSGWAERYRGGIWTGENITVVQTICDCPCGENLREELACRSIAQTAAAIRAIFEETPDA